ncbi:hypothetical protein LCGC14_1131450 [marine sediment metagenome]|uniref:Transcription factor zinc-finger domain-containing protein n=1 Tax=marine sediment metagenome TaxID=412755 RepID=A0A0F9PJ84_9ZZZZ
MTDHCPECGLRHKDLIPEGGNLYYRCGQCGLQWRIGGPDDRAEDATEAPGSTNGSVVSPGTPESATGD